MRRDRERTNEKISAAFKVCLFDLLANPFYARNIGELRPIMVNAYLGWQASNVIHDKAKQWFLKASIYNIIVHCAYLVGGMEWAERMTPGIWGFYEEVIMPNPTVALIGGAAGLGAAGIGAWGSKKASDAQQRAAEQAAALGYGASERAAELQWDIYQQSREDLAPWRAAGESALAKLQGHSGSYP